MTTSDPPELTILICVRNGAIDLTTALDSLARQTTDRFELLIVDDRSTDESRQLAEKHSIAARIVDSPGLGLATARNVGIRQVRSRYVTFLDHDDLYHPTRVERILDEISRDPDQPWFWTGYRTFGALDATSSKDYVLLDSTWPAALIRPGCELDVLASMTCPLEVDGSASVAVRSHEEVMNWGAAGAPLVSRVDFLVEAGGFPTHLGPAEDVLMMWNLARRAPIRVVDQPTYFYRLRSDSETRSMGLPWAYLSAVLSARFGGQHMTSGRALGHELPLPRDLVLEDALARAIARDGFQRAIGPLLHMLWLLYPEPADRRALFRRILAEWFRTRNPMLDQSVRRVRPVWKRH